MIDTTGLDNAAVLAVLYNNSKPLGMGFLHFDPELMTVDEAHTLLAENVRARPPGDGAYFDYLKGRVMKVIIKGDQLDPRLYDRDNGSGAAQRAINSIK